MSGYLYCIDNDIIKKLATFDLFDDTFKLFGVQPQQIRILSTAKYKFRKNQKQVKAGKSRKIQDNLTDYGKTLEIVESLPTIDISDISEIDSKVFESLSQIEGIEQGEAILTSYVVHLLQQSTGSEAFILTGDKVFLRALATLNNLGLQTVLNNRIWCLEQLVLMNIKVYGFEAVCNKIEPVRECDVAIKAVFGSGAQSTPNNALATLQSYIDELRAETGSLLHLYSD